MSRQIKKRPRLGSKINGKKQVMNISQLQKSRHAVQRLLSDRLLPLMPWDCDNMAFEECSDVNNKLGRYSNFSPRSKVEQKPSIKSVTNIIKVRRKQVLITDDAYYNRKAVSEMFNRLNVPTIEAINGKEAVAVVKRSLYGESEFDIQLILMDLEMPIMDGIEAAVEIRKLEQLYSKNYKIPIVAVTAHNSISDRNGCFKAGMQEHVVKPVTTKILKGILERYATELLKHPNANSTK